MSVNTTAKARKWEQTLQNIKYFAFWTFSILIVGGLSYFYYSYLMRPVAGSLFFVGGALVVYYYYIKWFKLPPPTDPDFTPGDQACPDYLTLIPPGDLYAPMQDGGYFCVDFVGVSENNRLLPTTPKNLAHDIKDPSHRFKVTPKVDLNPPKNKQRARAAFMQRLKNAGLSWNSLSGASIPSRVINRNGAAVYTGGGGIDFTADVNSLGNSVLAGAGCLTSADDTPPSAPPSWTSAAGAGGGGPAPDALMSASASAAAPAGSTNLITPQVIAEAVNYTVANGGLDGAMGATPDQQQQMINTLIKDEVSKGYLPAGTTMDQLQAAGKQLSSGGMAGNSAMLAQVMPLLTPASIIAVQTAMKNNMTSMGGGSPNMNMNMNMAQ